MSKKSSPQRPVANRSDQHLLNPDDLKSALNVPKSWIYARTRETGPGSIPRIKVGKYLRFELDAVMDWLRQQNEVDR